MQFSSDAFSKRIDALYAVFGKKPPAAATVNAIREMLGEDVSDAFLDDAVEDLSRLRRLPENVGLALLERLKAWRAARSMGAQSYAADDQDDACPHCGGRGWITVHCTSRPGVAPALVRCVCNVEPKLASQPAYTRETASRIPGGSLTDPWALPGARDAWLAEHRPATIREDAVPTDGDLEGLDKSSDMPKNTDCPY